MSTSSKPSLAMFSNALPLLGIVSLIGLSGYLLIRRTRPEKVIQRQFANTPYQRLTNFIIAQSKLESGNYKSALFKRANNGFGMKNAVMRNQTGFKVEGDPYRHYRSFTDSVNDFLLYLYSVNFPVKISTAADYADALNQRGYFEAPVSEYEIGLKSWMA